MGLFKYREDLMRENRTGRKAVRVLHTIFWKSGIYSENKRRIFRVIVEDILTYSSEIWTINTQLYGPSQGNGLLETDYAVVSTR